MLDSAALVTRTTRLRFFKKGAPNQNVLKKLGDSDSY